MRNDEFVESNDRNGTDYLMFGLAFVTFMIAAAGVEVNAPVLAIFGGLVLVFAVYSLGKRGEREEEAELWRR
jgi:hypothetical protein